jgi:hypothetical protein
MIKAVTAMAVAVELNFYFRWKDVLAYLMQLSLAGSIKQ